MARHTSVLSVALLLLLCPTTGLAKETPPDALYYRDVATEKGVGQLLRTRAIVGESDAVLVVLDTATFRPPPGQNEFNFTHDFPSDVTRWLDAIETLQQYLYL